MCVHMFMCALVYTSMETNDFYRQESGGKAPRPAATIIQMCSKYSGAGVWNFFTTTSYLANAPKSQRGALPSTHSLGQRLLQKLVFEPKLDISLLSTLASEVLLGSCVLFHI